MIQTRILFSGSFVDASYQAENMSKKEEKENHNDSANLEIWKPHDDVPAEKDEEEKAKRALHDVHPAGRFMRCSMRIKSSA